VAVLSFPHTGCQLRILPRPHHAEMKCFFHLFGHWFCPGGCNLHTSCVDYVAPSRADDVMLSPGKVAITLGWNWVSSSKAQTGSSLRFHVCE
jgi:hypothetical protein